MSGGERRRGGNRWKPAPVRFAARIHEVPAPAHLDLPCWQWDVLRPTTGYGDIYDGKKWYAHRWSYEFHVGPIPDGLELDHLCRNRGCVNPAHLEPVTTRENCVRGESLAGRNARRTHCVEGHEFTPENTYHRRDGGRACRACQRARNHRRRNTERSAA